MCKVRKRAVLNKLMRGDIVAKAIFEQRLEARKLTMSRYIRKKSVQRCDAQILRGVGGDSPDMISEHKRVIVAGAVRAEVPEARSQERRENQGEPWWREASTLGKIKASAEF